MRLRHVTPLVAALLAAGLTGCGSPAKPAAPAAQAAPATSGAPAAAPPATGAPVPGASADAAARPTGGGAATGTKGGNARPAPKGQPAAQPTPERAEGLVNPKFEATPEQLPIEASVTPACVAPGETATLTVVTKAKAHLAFIAVYADGKSGAAPPWGEGYGGAEQGVTDFRGQWSSTWVLAANAPGGKARAQLVVGIDGKSRAVNVPFSVRAREADGCGA